METTLHHYCLNTANKAEAEEWERLKEKLRPTHKMHHSHNGRPQPITLKNEAEAVTLDPAHLFNDQWNEAATEEDNGRRLFDWFLQYRLGNDKIRQGHYLELTPEMVEARDYTAECGYCGYQEPVGLHDFCPRCLGSEYLEEKELHLLRLMPVSWDRFRNDRPPLTEAEAADLLPRYKVAQGLGKEKREEQERSKARRRVAELIPEAEKKAQALLEAAKVETEAMTWLLDHGIKPDNVIYYNHTGRFCFGWRSSIQGQEREDLLEALRKFPFDYDIK